MVCSPYAVDFPCRNYQQPRLLIFARVTYRVVLLMGEIDYMNMPRKPRTGNLPAVRLAFGRAIRELRKNSGIAQERLAFESEVDRGYMSGLERGLHSPTLDTIMKLLWRMEISFADFATVFERELKRLKRSRPKS